MKKIVELKIEKGPLLTWVITAHKPNGITSLGLFRQREDAEKSLSNTKTIMGYEVKKKSDGYYLDLQ